MHILRKLLYGSAIVVVALAVIAFFLPRNVHVERSVSMLAPPGTVFDIVNGFQRFNEYSPWFEYDPKARYTFEGPPSGVGAKMSWQSDDASVGSGSQEIVKSEPIETVHSKLDFGSQGTALAVWTIVPEGDGSRVTWAFNTDLGMNPIARYMGLTFERFIGPDYERGLAKLKKVAEATAAASHSDGEAAETTRPNAA
jgi:Polyketide cyclase / dehydrase and lipid transport